MSDAANHNAPGPSAARWLNLLQAIAPTFGSSFYAKGKLVKRLVPPNPSTVVLDIIRQCSFGCAFCFAGQTQCRGDYTPLARLEPLLSELSGIGKLTLIGGEPFEHPELAELVRRGWDVACEEVEIFTNGAALPVEAEDAASFLAPLLPPAGQRLRLTLAVDDWHRARHGRERFQRLVAVWLELQRRSLVTAMFNVTDPRIHTTYYIDRPVIREVLEGLSPEIWEYFEQLADQGRVDEGFYLNPLIIQGRQQDTPGAECLRAVDFASHPEVVLTQRADGLRLVRALNAAWMSPVPAALDLGLVTDNLAVRVREGLVAARLEDDLRPWVLPLLDALLDPARREAHLAESARKTPAECAAMAGKLVAAVRADDEDGLAGLVAALCDRGRFMRLLNDPQGYARRQADWMEAVALHEPPQAPIELNGRQDAALVRLESLTALLEGLEGTGDLRGALEEPLRVWRLLTAGDRPLTPCVRPAANGPRVADSLPLAMTHLATGAGPWPDEREPCAVWLSLRAEAGRLKAAISGLELKPLALPDELRLASMGRFLDYHIWLFGRAARSLLERLRAETPEAYRFFPDERLEDFAAHPALNPALRRPRDLWAIFTEATFDPTRNRPSLDNPTLLQLLIDSDDYPGYEPEEVRAFTQRLAAWRERLSDPS